MPDAQIMDPNPHSLIKEPRLIEGLGQEVDKMSLEDLAIPESEEVLKKQTPSSNGMSKPQGYRCQPQELPIARAEPCEHHHKGLLDYITQSVIHVLILI